MPEDWGYEYIPAPRLNDRRHAFTPSPAAGTSMNVAAFTNLHRSKYTPDEVAQFFLDNLPHTIPTSTMQTEETGGLRAYRQEFVTYRDSSLGVHLGRKVLYVAGIACEATNTTYTAFFETPVADRHVYREIGHQIVDSIVPLTSLDELAEA